MSEVCADRLDPDDGDAVCVRPAGHDGIHSDGTRFTWGGRVVSESLIPAGELAARGVDPGHEHPEMLALADGLDA